MLVLALLTFASHVNPLVGTKGGGNTFPGATLPFGLVRLSPDTDTHNPSGYDSQGKIVGFSHTHVSGTGVPKYGNILVMPTVGPWRTAPSSYKSQEEAHPGYYKVTLTDHNIIAELTATQHGGFHRYTFAPNAKQPSVFIDPSHILYGERRHGSGYTINSDIRFDSRTQSISGFGTFEGGWNPGRWSVYFYGKFNQQPLALHTVKTSGSHNGLYLQFQNPRTPSSEPLLVKIGISRMSIEKARSNLEQEIPHWSFEQTAQEATALWNQTLGVVQVEGAITEQRNVFYTALYHSLLMPTDMTGENPYFESSDPYYEDYFCLWDTFRTVHPLITLLQPQRNAAMVNSLINVYKHTGWLPDSWTGGGMGHHQVGTNAEVLVTDAFVKGLTGIDYESALTAMMKNAEEESPEPWLYGRQGVADYKRLGYVPASQTQNSRSYNNTVSRTLEYIHDDFCIYTLAQGLGHTNVAQRYRNRCTWYTNLWDQQTQFMRGRTIQGSWLTPFDPNTWEHWGASYYEGNAWHWSFFVSHDMGGLINLHGGDALFTERLETMLMEHFNQGNEPDLNNPYLFIYAGKPHRTQYWVRELLKNFTTQRNGIPGNDDAGTLSAWYVWGALGLYPIAGQNLYLLTSPLFTRSVLQLAGGKTFTIEAPLADDRYRYIQRATLNGEPLNRAFLRHGEITEGGVLHFDLGPEPHSEWGAAERPPSLSRP